MGEPRVGEGMKPSKAHVEEARKLHGTQASTLWAMNLRNHGHFNDGDRKQIDAIAQALQEAEERGQMKSRNKRRRDRWWKVVNHLFVPTEHNPYY